MNILEITESLKDLSDQELAGAGAPEYLKQQEISRRLDVRNRYQAQQAQVDATKTVAEKNLEQLMMGGIAGADPMMGQEGDPSMQAGIAGGMEAPPPQGPPMMYGGGILGFQEGDLIEPDPDDPFQIPAELQGTDYEIPFSIDSFDYEPNLQAMGTRVQDYNLNIADLEAQGLSDAEIAEEMVRRSSFERRLQSRLDDAYKDYKEEYAKTPAGLRDPDGHMTKNQFVQQNPDLAIPFGQQIMDPSQRRYRGIRTPADVDFVRDIEGQSGAVYGDLRLPSERERERVSVMQADAAAREEQAAAADAVAVARETLERQRGTRAQEAAVRDLGLGSVQSLYADAGKRIDDAMKYAMDPENYAAATEARQLAADRALERAEGINTLAQSRMEEQEGLLAQELGLSRERVAELRSEMETPESIEKRRRASLFSALGATLMGSPRELGAGLERTTDKLLDLDEEIATERRTALTNIFDERKRGMERERAGRGEIYTTESGALTNLTNAQNAFDNEMYNMAQAVADRNVSAYTKAGDQMAALLMDQAKTVSQYMQSSAAMDNELEKMQIQGKNYWVDPTNWPRIDEIIEDTRSAAERFKGEDNERYAQLIATADQMEEMKLGAAIQSGRGVVTSATERTVSTEGLVPLQTGNTSATPS